MSDALSAGVGVIGKADLAAYAKAMLAARMRLSDYFDPALFADPALHILLSVYVFDEAEDYASITDACAASNVPNTTALRWIGALEQQGLLTRSPDPGDRRRSYLPLTPVARGKMQAWLTTVIADFPHGGAISYD